MPTWTCRHGPPKKTKPKEVLKFYFLSFWAWAGGREPTTGVPRDCIRPKCTPMPCSATAAAALSAPWGWVYILRHCFGARNLDFSKLFLPKWCFCGPDGQLACPGGSPSGFCRQYSTFRSPQVDPGGTNIAQVLYCMHRFAETCRQYSTFSSPHRQSAILHAPHRGEVETV